VPCPLSPPPFASEYLIVMSQAAELQGTEVHGTFTEVHGTFLPMKKKPIFSINVLTVAMSRPK